VLELVRMGSCWVASAAAAGCGGSSVAMMGVKKTDVAKVGRGLRQSIQLPVLEYWEVSRGWSSLLSLRVMQRGRFGPSGSVTSDNQVGDIYVNGNGTEGLSGGRIITTYGCNHGLFIC